MSSLNKGMSRIPAVLFVETDMFGAAILWLAVVLFLNNLISFVQISSCLVLSSYF